MKTLLIISICLMVGTAQAYPKKCKDANGKVTYQEKKCPSNEIVNDYLYFKTEKDRSIISKKKDEAKMIAERDEIDKTIAKIRNNGNMNEAEKIIAINKVKASYLEMKEKRSLVNLPNGNLY